MDANEPERSCGEIKVQAQSHSCHIWGAWFEEKKKTLLLSLPSSYKMTKSLGHCFKVILVSPQSFL